MATGRSIEPIGSATSDLSEVLGYDMAGRVQTTTLMGAVISSMRTSTYSYDAAGRLVSASVGAAAAAHAYAYGYGLSGGCGVMAGAGLNSDRTSQTVDGVTTTYCYDDADRLTSTTDVALGTPVYDAHGNATSVGGTAFGYDQADRHILSSADGTTEEDVRGPSGRVIARDVTAGGVETVTRYGYTGEGSAPSLVMSGTGVLLQRSAGLPGGMAMIVTGAGVTTFEYANERGDVIATINSGGVISPSPTTYDPFGNPVTAAQDDSPGDYDLGWLGGPGKGIATDHEPGLLTTVDMGERVYLPTLGRFLQVDPVPGGSCNPYDYTCQNPVNGFDLNGRIYQLDAVGGPINNGYCPYQQDWCFGTSNYLYERGEIHLGIHYTPLEVSIGADVLCVVPGVDMAVCAPAQAGAYYDRYSSRHGADAGPEDFTDLTLTAGGLGMVGGVTSGSAEKLIEALGGKAGVVSLRIYGSLSAFMTDIVELARQGDRR